MPVTVRQVAEAAGVSRSTANMILTGRTETYAQQTCQRVLDAARRLSYTPNLNPRSHKPDRTFLIGAVINRVNNPFLGEFLEGFQHGLTEQGCAPILFVAEDARAEQAALDICTARRVDGLIVNPNPVPGDTAGLDAVLTAKESGTPIVEVFGRSFNGAVPAVIGDAYLVGRRATENMLELGNRRIFLLQSRLYDEDSVPDIQTWFELGIYRGYRDAMRDAGLEPLTRKVNAADTTADRRQAAIDLLKGDKPDGVLTMSRRYIEHLHHLAHARPKLAPKGFTLAGFEHCFPTSLSQINRVMIELPICDAARLAVRELFNLIDGREAHDCSLSPIIDVLRAGE